MFFVWLFIVIMGILGVWFVKVGKQYCKEDKGSELLLLLGWILLFFCGAFAVLFMTI